MITTVRIPSHLAVPTLLLTKHNMSNITDLSFPCLLSLVSCIILVVIFLLTMYLINPQGNFKPRLFRFFDAEYIRIPDDTKLLYDLVTFMTHFERN